VFTSTDGAISGYKTALDIAVDSSNVTNVTAIGLRGGAWITGSQNRISQFTVYASNGNGLTLSGTGNNITGSLFNGSTAGLDISGNENNINDTNASSDSTAISLEASNNTLTNIRATSISDRSIYIGTGFSNNLTGVTAISNDGNAILLESSQSNRLTNILAYSASANGISLDIDSNNNIISNSTSSSNISNAIREGCIHKRFLGEYQHETGRLRDCANAGACSTTHHALERSTCIRTHRDDDAALGFGKQYTVREFCVAWYPSEVCFYTELSCNGRFRKCDT
jgi:flagellar basal body rod protein FlgB